MQGRLKAVTWFVRSLFLLLFLCLCACRVSPCRILLCVRVASFISLVAGDQKLHSQSNATKFLLSYVCTYTWYQSRHPHDCSSAEKDLFLTYTARSCTRWSGRIIPSDLFISRCFFFPLRQAAATIFFDSIRISCEIYRTSMYWLISFYICEASCRS